MEDSQVSIRSGRERTTGKGAANGLWPANFGALQSRSTGCGIIILFLFLFIIFLYFLLKVYKQKLQQGEHPENSPEHFFCLN